VGTNSFPLVCVNPIRLFVLFGVMGDYFGFFSDNKDNFFYHTGLCLHKNPQKTVFKAGAKQNPGQQQHIIQQ